MLSIDPDPGLHRDDSNAINLCNPCILAVQNIFSSTLNNPALKG